MSDLFGYLAGVPSFLSAAILSAIVLTRHIREGLIVKAGLIMMIGALLATGCLSYEAQPALKGLWNSSLLLISGLVVVLLGLIWKFYIHREPGK